MRKQTIHIRRHLYPTIICLLYTDRWKWERGGKTQHHNHTGLWEVKNSYTYSWDKKQWSSVYDHKETLTLEDAVASCNIQARREKLAFSELLSMKGASNEEYLMLPLKIPHWQETHISSVDLKETQMCYQSIWQIAVYFSDWILSYLTLHY